MRVRIPVGGIYGHAKSLKGNDMSHTTTTATLISPDISCDHCVATVNKALGEIDGVTTVESRADTKEVVVTYEPGNVSETKIREVLDEAGYPASS